MVILKYKEPSFIISVRFLCVMMILLGYCLNYMQKIDMGIAIVCMTNHTALKLMESNKTNLALNYNHSTSTSNDCPVQVNKQKSEVCQFYL